jgi:hypothetical protein
VLLEPLDGMNNGADDDDDNDDTFCVGSVSG